MPGNETKRPSKWWFWALPILGLLYALTVIAVAEAAERFYLIGEGRRLSALLWPGRVAYLLLEPMLIGLGLCARDWGRWVVILLPLLALLSASLVVGLSVRRLAARAYVEALLPVLVLLLVVSGLFCLRVIGQGTGFSSQGGGALPGAAGDPAHRYQDVLDEIRQEYFVRSRRYLWEGGMFLDPKTGYGAFSGIFHSVVESQIAALGMSEFLTLIEARAAQPEEFTGWDIAVATHLVIYLVLDSSDRGSLVTLLSLHCPRYVGLSSRIEEFVARAGQGRLPTPILALCDAYDRSTAPTAKEALVNALDTAFLDIKDEGLHEGARVDAYRQWYLERKDRLVLNPDYDGYSNALFVTKGMVRYSAVIDTIWGEYRARGLSHPPDGTSVQRRAQHLAMVSLLRDIVQSEVEALGIEEFLNLLEVSLPEPRQFADWEVPVLEALVVYLVDSGDRGSLVKLVSLRPLWKIRLRFTEWHLAKHGRETLVDPILVFCDAYDRSTVPGAKKALAQALHRAFPMLRDEGGDEGAFVQSCRQWYLEHKGRLVLNPDYEYYRHTDTPLFLLLEPEGVKEE